MIRIVLKKRGYSGIEDGLKWERFDAPLKPIKTINPKVFLAITWWWRLPGLQLPSDVYLRSRLDHGGNLPFTYEAVARLCGRYPFASVAASDAVDAPETGAVPFSLLSAEEAEDFAEIFQVKEDPRYAPPLLHGYDPFTSPRLKTVKEGGSGLREELDAKMIECYRAYSQPVRFNLLSSKREHHRALDGFLNSIGHNPAKTKLKFPQTGKWMKFQELESWDWRRWKEDFKEKPTAWKKLENLPEQLWQGREAPAINNPSLTRARRLAINAVNRAKKQLTKMNLSAPLSHSKKQLVEFVQAIRFEKCAA